MTATAGTRRGLREGPLERVLSHSGIWRGRQRRHVLPAIPSGQTALDRRLPGGGWPLGAVTELLTGRPGLGEVSLLLPAMTQLARRGGWLILLDPPWVPCPAAFQGAGLDLQRLVLVRTRNAGESLWACEQALRVACGGAVLAWLHGKNHHADFTHLRRLQLAARGSRQCAFIFRSPQAAGRSSPAALRLHLRAEDSALELTLLKCRGARQGETLRLRRPGPEPCRLQRRSATPPEAVRFPRPASRGADRQDDERTLAGH